MKTQTQQNLFGIEKIDFTTQVNMTIQSMNEYGPRHDHWAIAWSMGKDSTTLLTLVVQLILSKQIAAPKSLTVLCADTRMELPPLWYSAQGIIQKLEEMDIDCNIVTAPINDRFMVYILGRGVPPPSNTFRWCTGQIKVEPMEAALKSLHDRIGQKILMLTGVRQGESAIRDGRIAMSCSKDGAECGQGWYQTGLDGDMCSTLAPIIHWRVCSVWDWLKIFAPMKKHGAWPTELLADAYGGDEAEEVNARTGCIGCPLTNQDRALMEVVKIDRWKYLLPLMELKPIYREMRFPKHRLRKDGQTKKDGTLSKNQQRLGPLTFEARAYFMEKILNIQNRVNENRGNNPSLFLIDSEEQSTIEKMWEDQVWPNGWDGNEVTGDVWLDKKYNDGSILPTLFKS